VALKYVSLLSNEREVSMTKYAFVIDQRKYIGCHACTVACKAEHVVMLVLALFVPVAQPALLGVAGIFALAGLFAYEHCFVTAGQIVPLS
jgi:hypothetical protein